MRNILILITLLLLSCSKDEKFWHGGIDNNSNGVRDDIESWILERYKKDTRVQHALLDLAAVDPASCEYKDKLICLDQVTEESLVIQLELLEKILDTSQRRVAFEKRVQKCVVTDDRNLTVKCNF